MKTLEWDILHPDRFINLKINYKRRTIFFNLEIKKKKRSSIDLNTRHSNRLSTFMFNETSCGGYITQFIFFRRWTKYLNWVANILVSQSCIRSTWTLTWTSAKGSGPLILSTSKGSGPLILPTSKGSVPLILSTSKGSGPLILPRNKGSGLMILCMSLFSPFSSVSSSVFCSSAEILSQTSSLVLSVWSPSFVS